VGQTRQELPGRSGNATGLRCTCCGEPLAGAAVEAVLREVVYEYCDENCRDRHADAVETLPAGCELCDLDAVGDTGRCAAHLDAVYPDDEAAEGSAAFALAG
jgi:hypothetical protein